MKGMGVRRISYSLLITPKENILEVGRKYKHIFFFFFPSFLYFTSSAFTRSVFSLPSLLVFLNTSLFLCEPSLYEQERLASSVNYQIINRFLSSETIIQQPFDRGEKLELTPLIREKEIKMSLVTLQINPHLKS